MKLSVTDSAAVSHDVEGVYRLVERRIPRLKDRFTFVVSESTNGLESYQVTQEPSNRNVTITGSTLSAISYGLHVFLRQHGHSLTWAGSSLAEIAEMPVLAKPLEGTAQCKWRYHFNTCTFAYTTVFFKWEDWEYQLDWMALMGINFALAWNGFEQVLIETFRSFGIADADIFEFISGPAFLPWNRFGNIQGSWDRPNDEEWTRSQLELQKLINKRMLELGITPILPSFTGFVPSAFPKYSSDEVVKSSNWNRFDERFSNVSFLNPLSESFMKLQKLFINIQESHFGKITHFYTLDQYNENSPTSGDLEFLKNVSEGTMRSLKQADKDAVWVLQGWMFYYEQDFWTDERVDAYFSGLQPGESLILDLYSEVYPQWQRTGSYKGNDWIWCHLHGYGHNHGLGGSMQIIAENSVAANQESETMCGMGNTMEGQEGNQIVYDLTLDQAWSSTPIDSEDYVRFYVKARYGSVCEEVYAAWELLRKHIYTNAYEKGVYGVVKSVFELRPAMEGIADVKGDHPTKIYWDTAALRRAWELLYSAVVKHPEYLKRPSFHHDIVDVTRQILSDDFVRVYKEFVAGKEGGALIEILELLDPVLSTNPHFYLGTWIGKARALASDSDTADWYEYNARNQVTIWGPTGQEETLDYAGKQWGGLIADFHIPRWKMFLKSVSENQLNIFEDSVREFELDWQHKKWEKPVQAHGNLAGALAKVHSYFHQPCAAQ